MDQDIKIVPATLEDAEAILDLQQCAYQTEAEIYERLGYRPFRREKVNEKVTLVFLEKIVLTF
jgi:hypothetical protein